MQFQCDLGKQADILRWIEKEADEERCWLKHGKKLRSMHLKLKRYLYEFDLPVETVDQLLDLSLQIAQQFFVLAGGFEPIDYRKVSSTWWYRKKHSMHILKTLYQTRLAIDPHHEHGQMIVNFCTEILRNQSEYNSRYDPTIVELAAEMVLVAHRFKQQVPMKAKLVESLFRSQCSFNFNYILWNQEPIKYYLNSYGPQQSQLLDRTTLRSRTGLKMLRENQLNKIIRELFIKLLSTDQLDDFKVIDLWRIVREEANSDQRKVFAALSALSELARSQTELGSDSNNRLERLNQPLKLPNELDFLLDNLALGPDYSKAATLHLLNCLGPYCFPISSQQKKLIDLVVRQSTNEFSLPIRLEAARYLYQYHTLKTNDLATTISEQGEDYMIELARLYSKVPTDRYLLGLIEVSLKLMSNNKQRSLKELLEILMGAMKRLASGKEYHEPLLEVAIKVILSMLVESNKNVFQHLESKVRNTMALVEKRCGQSMVRHTSKLLREMQKLLEED